MRKSLDNLFFKLESIFKLDVKYLASSLFVLSATSVIITLLSFCKTIAFTRSVGLKVIYAQYGYVSSIVGILAIFSLPGLGTTIVQNVSRGKDGYFLYAVKNQSKYSLLGATCFFLLSLFYFLTNRTEMGWAFAICTVLFIPYTVSNSFRGILFGRKKFSTYSKFSILIAVVNVILTSLFILLTGNFILIILVNLLSYTSMRMLFFTKAKRGINEEIVDKESLKFSKHLTLMSAAGIAYGYFDKVLLYNFADKIETAEYFLAWTIYFQTSTLLKLLNVVIMPKLSALPVEKAFRKVKKYFGLTFLLSLTFGISAFLLIKPVISIIFPAYLKSVVYFRIIITGFAIGFPAGVVVTLLKSHSKTAALYNFNLFLPLVILVISFFLITRYSAIGAASSRALHGAVSIVMAIYHLYFKKWKHI